MSGDRISEAVAAIIDETRGWPTAPHRTRARVLTQLREREQRGRRWRLAALIVAGMLCSTAAGAALRDPIVRTIARTRAVVAQLVWRAPSRTPPVTPATEAGGGEGPGPRPAPAALDRFGPVPQIVTAAWPGAGASAGQSSPRRARQALAAAGDGALSAARPLPPPAPESATALSPPPRVTDAMLELYQTAHGLHFGAATPERTLAAWDAYLRATSSHAFVPEARYNRTVCLLRLGQLAAAREALAPFARGEVAGGYRRREAEALLRAIAARMSISTVF